MLDTKKGKRLKDYVPDYVIFDLETTGTSYKNDAIIEVSAVKVIGGGVVEEFSSLVNEVNYDTYLRCKLADCGLIKK